MVEFISLNKLITEGLVQYVPSFDDGTDARHFLTHRCGVDLVSKVEVGEHISLKTAPLALPLKMDLMTGPHFNRLVNLKKITNTPELHSSMYIDRIYFELMGELFCVSVGNQPYASAVRCIESQQLLNFSYNTKASIQVREGTQTYTGELPYWGPLLRNEPHSLFAVTFQIDGTVDRHTGKAVFGVTDIKITPSGPPQKLSKFMAAMERTAKVVGFTLNAIYA